MTPDELDALSDQQLNEVFAVEVCGWQVKPRGMLWDPVGNRTHIIDGGVLHRKRTQMGLPSDKPFVVDFSTDANAVLPWLEKAEHWTINETAATIERIRGGWSIYLPASSWNDAGFIGTAPTLARAACCALIRAKRAQLK